MQAHNTLRVCLCVCVCVYTRVGRFLACVGIAAFIKWQVTMMISNLGLARTIYIRCIYGIFSRRFFKYTVIYGVYIRFWPTLLVTKIILNVSEVVLPLSALCFS